MHSVAYLYFKKRKNVSCARCYLTLLAVKGLGCKQDARCQRAAMLPIYSSSFRCYAPSRRSLLGAPAPPLQPVAQTRLTRRGDKAVRRFRGDNTESREQQPVVQVGVGRWWRARALCLGLCLMHVNIRLHGMPDSGADNTSFIPFAAPVSMPGTLGQ